MELLTKNGKVVIFTENIEESAINQITLLSNSTIGENANIKIMPDVHAGKGCVIGTTMKITDKICPNIVGVDIACGVTLVKTDCDFKLQLAKLDDIIHKNIPSGKNMHSKESFFDPLQKMRCWTKLKKQAQETSKYSLGTLGGGNHFIETYENGYISVHSGSRNIGHNVAAYYQNLAFETLKKQAKYIDLSDILPQDRENYIKANRPIVINKDFAYLTSENMEDYLFDMEILNRFAYMNRLNIITTICKDIGCNIVSCINSTHNYIDTETMILRKGAICADKDKMLVIPLNMRDGLLICKGKGNIEWNNSAPHGAGRLYSRSKCKELFTVEQFSESMQGIYSTCINKDTVDEAPFAYKSFNEIIKYIEPTVEIIERLIPIYNFKASE